MSRVPLVTQITDRVRVPWPVLAERMARARAPIAIQVRDKDLDASARRALATAVRDVARPLGHVVVLNGAWELAAELGLDGAHLPASLADRVDAVRRAMGPAALVTVACHELADVAEAARRGADAALLSPIYATPGKGEPLGLDALRAARAALETSASKTALVALGGIDARTATTCIEAGAHGVAAISADLTRWR